VFSSKERAIAACKDERYWIGPATLDVEVPEESITWPRYIRPLESEP
jgi:hypothetical protein